MLALFRLLAPMSLVLGWVLCLPRGLLAQVRRTRRAVFGPRKWVAEVWLEWPLCRGSTLYRSSFRWRWLAMLSARWHAWRLDTELPRGWRDIDYLGRPYWEPYEFGVYWGVRRPTPRERRFGAYSIWSPKLPGHKGYRGEHPSAHPWVCRCDDADVSLSGGSLQDFKL